MPDGVLHPRLIESGVVAGVADYGNKIGLPTVAGAVLYDPGYIANPLVYCGCIGIADDAPLLTGPNAGDLVVVLGGRTGRDGLRGATFSSATMDATTGDVAGASVQIGDPIVEKLLIDVLRDADRTVHRDHRLRGRRAVVGDRRDGRGNRCRRRSGRCAAEVPGPAAVGDLAQRSPGAHGRGRPRFDVVAIATTLRTATASKQQRSGRSRATACLHVRHGDTTVLHLDTHFLHDGRPQRYDGGRAADAQPRHRPLPRHARMSTATLLALLRHPNIASKESVIRRYDHEILGSTVVRPLVGRRRDGHADGVVIADPADTHGLAIGIGVNPWFGELDPHRMAHAVVDEAIRNVVAVGADPDKIALLDNFSWGDPRRPSTLGELVAAVRGCCEASVAHHAPFVSGKDSLNNEYLGADGARHSVPPTLVITAIAHVPDVNAAVTPDLKQRRQRRRASRLDRMRVRR